MSIGCDLWGEPNELVVELNAKEVTEQNANSTTKYFNKQGASR